MCSLSTCRPARSQRGYSSAHGIFPERDRPPDGFRLDPSPEIVKLLVTYDWPGNVRELEHCVSRIPLPCTPRRAANGRSLHGAAVPPIGFGHGATGRGPGSGAWRRSSTWWPIPRVPLPEAERRAIARSFRRRGGGTQPGGAPPQNRPHHAVSDERYGRRENRSGCHL